jgi:hypothetical protein
MTAREKVSECDGCFEVMDDGVSKVMRLACSHLFHVECMTGFFDTLLPIGVKVKSLPDAHLRCPRDGCHAPLNYDDEKTLADTA